MRSDNNKPWGTHRTVKIPPAQLEPRDPRRVELLWIPQNPRGFTHRKRPSNSLAFPPPLCEWSRRQTQPRCCSVPSQADGEVGGQDTAPCWDTPAAPCPSLCASRAAHWDAGVGVGASWSTVKPPGVEWNPFPLIFQFHNFFFLATYRNSCNNQRLSDFKKQWKDPVKLLSKPTRRLIIRCLLK